MKYKKNAKQKIIEFSKTLRDIKKFKKSAMNDRKIMPNNDIFSTSWVCN
jgi:hypothetical protein